MSDGTTPISWRPPEAYIRAQRKQYVRDGLLPLIRGSLIAVVICGGVFLLGAPVLPDLPWVQSWVALIGGPLMLTAAALFWWWHFGPPLIALDPVGIRLKDRTTKWQDVVTWRVMPVPSTPALRAVQLSVRGRKKPVSLPLPLEGEAAVLRALQERLGPAAGDYVLPDPELSSRALLLLCLLSLAYVACLVMPLSSYVWAVRPHTTLGGLIGLAALIVGPGTPWALFALRSGRGRTADIVSLGFYTNVVSNALCYVLAMILQLRQAMP